MYIPNSRELDDDYFQRKYNDLRDNHGCNSFWAGKWLVGMTTDRWDYFRDNIIPILEKNYEKSKKIRTTGLSKH